MQGGGLALKRLLVPRRQELLIQELVVSCRRFLVLAKHLLGVAQFEKDVALARLGLRVGVRQLLGLVGRLAERVNRSLERLLVLLRIAGIGGPDLRLCDPQQRLIC